MLMEYNIKIYTSFMHVSGGTDFLRRRRCHRYEPLKNFYLSELDGIANSSSLIIKIAAGGTTGAIGSAIANPCDLIKVQQQSFTGPLANDTPLPQLLKNVRARLFFAYVPSRCEKDYINATLLLILRYV